ncbi:MAG: CHAT domain-containing protein, partial [Anaerolineales bacterium]|nr:CHAT domain-containing protein [Anaerolineales bacterium]
SVSSQTSHVLRLSQFAEAQDTFRVELSLNGGAPVRTRFTFALSPQDDEDLRWYLEDYLQYPLDPAPTIAARVEARMKDIGENLFHSVFESGEPARRMWARLQPELNNTRVEIITDVAQATAIPWELMRDPLMNEVLALRARQFVRAPSDQAQPPKLPQVSEGKIRILLVICRPNAGADVPFRSVASRIVKSLSEQAREFVQLDVLRPPTFEQLGKVLREAKFRGQPYHVVHFDGHGTYAELIPPQKDEDKKAYELALQEIRKRLSAIVMGTVRAGRHGYLLFENPQSNENMMLVDGSPLGKLLVENDVAALVLNACQSAMAEAPTAPLTASESSEVGAQIRAFGSLAQEVMDTGVASVVAMRYILYVETAKRFVADLYAALAQGQSLGEAVTFGRKQLAINPQREIAYKPINLQDWCVPIVYETAAVELFPRAVGATGSSPLRITLDSNLKLATSNLELNLPPRPDVGFFGRDETLLALDRAFDSQRIVLLHAFAGSGKTTTAAEFARWYALTGGVEGAIFFTSFERRKTLVEALNETIGRAFNNALEQSGIHWL